jgi:hypothetical protein
MEGGEVWYDKICTSWTGKIGGGLANEQVGELTGRNIRPLQFSELSLVLRRQRQNTAYLSCSKGKAGKKTSTSWHARSGWPISCQNDAISTDRPSVGPSRVRLALVDEDLPRAGERSTPRDESDQ